MEAADRQSYSWKSPLTSIVCPLATRRAAGSLVSLAMSYTSSTSLGETNEGVAPVSIKRYTPGVQC